MAEPKYSYNELRDAAKMAMDRGDQGMLDHIVGKIKNRDYKDEQSDVVSAGIGFSQGATLGFGDEIAAGLRATLEGQLDPLIFATEQSIRRGLGDEDQPEEWKNMSFGDLYGQRRELFWEGSDWMDRYKAALGSGRGMLETARREDPWITAGGELAGGLLQGGRGAAKSFATAGKEGFKEGLKESMKLGGKYGAAYGYGSSEADPMAALLAGENFSETASEAFEALKDTGESGAAGVAFGGMFPVIGAGLRNMARFLTRSGTKNVRLNEAGRRQIAEAIEEDLVLRDITPEQAIKEINATPGMTLADLGPNVQARMEQLVTSGTRSGKILEDFLETRVAGQYDRIVPSMSKALGLKGEPSMFHHHVQKLLDSAEEAATPLYREAYTSDITLTPRMINILNNTGTGKAGRKEAIALAEEALEDIGSKLRRDDLVVGGKVPMKHMDFVLRGMDGHVDGLFRSKGAKRSRAFDAGKRRDDFRAELFKQNQAFEDARAAWAGPQQSKRALEAGKSIFKEDAEITATQLGKMSEGERLYYRVGVLKAVEDKLARKKDYQDLVSDLKSVKSTRDALRVAFGSDQNFDDFMDLLGREAMMQQTASRALGNSATARRLAEKGSDFGEQLAALGGYGVSLSFGGWVPPSIGGYLSRRGYQAFDPQRQATEAYKQIAGNQAGMLMGSDLQQALQKQTLGGLLDTGVPTSTVPLTGAAATTGLLNPETQYGL
jgi:hypothetical protein